MFIAVKPADAANPTTIAFQGKVVSNASGLVGTNVADGTYTFIFKLYNTATSSGSTVTSASCSGDTHCLWAESDSVTVTSGVFQVNLGANTSLSSIDFNANNALYLGIEFNGDTAEMSPRPQLQSVPYAFNSDKVGGFTASQLAQLQTGTVSPQTGSLSVSGSGTFGTNLTVSTLTAGSVPFIGAGGLVTQNNSKLYYDNTNNRLGIGTNAPVYSLTVSGASQQYVDIISTAGDAGFIFQNATSFTIGGLTGSSGAGDFLNTSQNNEYVVDNRAGGGIVLSADVNYTRQDLYITPAGNVAVGATNLATSLFNVGASNQFQVNSSGAIAATTGIANSGGYVQSGATANTLTGATTLSSNLTVQNATYTSGQVVINDGQTTAPPTYPTSYAPSLAVVSSETANSKPFFFGYNTGSSAYAGYFSGGECGGSYNQLCLDLGSTATDYTALENAGTTLEVGGGDDGTFATTSLMSTATNVTGTLAVTGATSLAGNLAFTGTAATTITGPSNQSFTLQSGGTTGQLTLNSASGTLGLSAATATIQRVATGTTTLDLKDSGNTVLQLFNSGTGVANLQLYGGVLCTGSTACTVGGTTQRLDNAGDLTNIGNYTSTGGVSGGEINDARTETTNATTFAYTEAGDYLGYYLSSTSYPGAGGVGGTAPVNDVSTFTVTGLPSTDGTLAYFTINNVKQAAANLLNTATTHSVVLVIGAQTIATLTNASSANASTITRSFIVMRMNGTWRIVGEPPVTAATAAQSTATTADYAEYIDYSGDAKPQPGDVLTVGDDATSVKDATVAYDTDALGVVSTSPYEVGGADDGHSVVLALTGRVPVNVNLQNGPIKAGDKLTASSTSGEAMKATKAGHIIGTALSDYDGSQASAQVIVQLGAGYDNPSDDAAAEVISPSATDDGALQPNTDVTPAVTTDDGITTVGSQALKFIDGAGLDLTSDVSGNAISLVDTPDNLAKANANGIFVQQGKAAAGATTGLSGALTIDNADARLPIGAAINITNTGGGGYTSVISSTNFSVSGTGNVSANGAYISKNGSFQLVDATGKQLIDFDNNGNGTLTGALNVASANISGGLTVGGDLNVAGLSTFQKLSTFLAKTVFRQDVEFDGHITVANDSAGYASLRPGETTVHVSFQKPYDTAPIVNASVTNGQFVLDEVTNVTPQGFDINLQTAATVATNFSWTAIAVTNPLTATNPQTSAVPSTTPATATAATTTTAAAQ